MADQPLRLKKSSQIHSATYDPSTLRFTAVLNDGTFAYHQVPSDIAYGIEKASSAGKYFHQHIRNSPQFTRVR